MSKTFRDQQIKQAIEGVFNTYDKDRSNTLDQRELRLALTQIFRKMGMKKEVTSDDIKNFMSILDQNQDGKISRSELYQIFKKIAL